MIDITNSSSGIKVTWGLQWNTPVGNENNNKMN